MTNELHMLDILSNAERLARQDDRVAFFVAVLALIVFGVLAIRYFVAQNAQQFIQLKEISADLRTVVVNNTATVETCKAEIRRNTEVLEDFARTNFANSNTRRFQKTEIPNGQA